MNKEQLYELIMKKENGPAVYGVAWHNAERIIKNGEVDFEVLNKTIRTAIWNNRFHKAEKDDMKVLETICHWFYVDPKLFLLYLH